MRNVILVSGFLLTLLIAGAAWTTQPTSGHRATVVGRVTSVGASGQVVTIEATDASKGLKAIAVGEPVEILLASDAPPAGELDTSLVGLPHGDTAKNELSRRLMGLWLLTVFGAVVAIRARRPRLI